MTEQNETLKQFTQRVVRAREQGIPICHAHFPAGIMYSTDGVNWTCPVCDNTRHTTESQPSGLSTRAVIVLSFVTGSVASLVCQAIFNFMQ